MVFVRFVAYCIDRYLLDRGALAILDLDGGISKENISKSLAIIKGL